MQHKLYCVNGLFQTLKIYFILETNGFLNENYTLIYIGKCVCHEVGGGSHSLLMAKEESWWSWGTFNGSTWNQRGKILMVPINAPFSWPLKTVEPGNLNKGKVFLGIRSQDLSDLHFFA